MIARLVRHAAYRRRRFHVWQRSLVFRHPTPERAVWICSWQRSGSTWLAEQLASAPRTRLVYEPANVPDGIVTGEDAARRVHPVASPQHSEYIARALAGRVSGVWVDQLNRSHYPSRHVVKDVRAMALLGDVRQLVPQTPIVILLRHPFNVAASVVRLGWFDSNLTTREAFFLEVKNWCDTHAAQLKNWQSASVASERTRWTTYEELTGLISGEGIVDIVEFLTRHNETWRDTASHLDPEVRSATDFGGSTVEIDQEWRDEAMQLLVESGWGDLYDEHGHQRISISQFLARTAR